MFKLSNELLSVLDVRTDKRKSTTLLMLVKVVTGTCCSSWIDLLQKIYIILNYILRQFLSQHYFITSNKIVICYSIHSSDMCGKFFKIIFLVFATCLFGVYFVNFRVSWSKDLCIFCLQQFLNHMQKEGNEQVVQQIACYLILVQWCKSAYIHIICDMSIPVLQILSTYVLLLNGRCTENHKVF